MQAVRVQCKQKASDPKPLLVGSVTVNAAAVAMAASMLLPPSANISRPAWAANGWLVATTESPKTGSRRDG